MADKTKASRSREEGEEEEEEEEAGVLEEPAASDRVTGGAMDEWKEHFHYAMESVNEIPFVLHYVTTNFDSTTAFSDSSFQLAAYADDRLTRRLGLTVSELFTVALKPEHAEALTFIMHSRRQVWPLQPNVKKREQQVVVELASQILLPLSRTTEVLLEKRYSRLPKPDGLRCAYLGMGSVYTWHGTPDVRVRGAEVVVESVDEGDEVEVDTDSDESHTSDGATTNLEAKVLYSVANLPQVITTCVVSSFTEKNCHPDKQALLPTILMDQNQFRVCLYDCEKDVLLISDYKLLATKGGLSSSGLAFLWLVINHR